MANLHIYVVLTVALLFVLHLSREDKKKDVEE